MWMHEWQLLPDLSFMTNKLYDKQDKIYTAKCIKHEINAVVALIQGLNRTLLSFRGDRTEQRGRLNLTGGQTVL